MAARRRGIQGLQQNARAKEQFGKVGSEIQKQQLDQLQAQLATFRSNLEDFASKYRKDIRRDPEFRMHFQRMCSNIGVDPLASNKGFWSELLGVGDFYYELGVQIVEVCLATRERNGGLIDLAELKRLVERMRGGGGGKGADGSGKVVQEISEDDIARSIKNLSPLGSGIDLVTIGSRRMVSSLPRELNQDYGRALAQAQEGGEGFTTAGDLGRALGWDSERAERVLETLMKDGVCWIDSQVHPPRYYVAGFFTF
ncbi:Vacuolar protein sorting-associated protein SNF8 [Irineochytrium annulatum]|nr:Vacuolar protein sorting-associated protein SNF8 [Irineochytrium annulatum]